MPRTDEQFRRALVEAGWEIDVERLTQVLAGGGTILAAAPVFHHLYAQLVGPMPRGATRFAAAGIEICLSKYLRNGEIVASLR